MIRGHARSRSLMVAALVAMMLIVNLPVAVAQGGTGEETNFRAISSQYGVGRSVGATVGLLGQTGTVGGWTAIVSAAETCLFNDKLLSDPDSYILTSDGKNIQQELLRRGVIEWVEDLDPESSALVLAPASGWEHRFGSGPYVLTSAVGGRYNCVQGGLRYIDSNCSLVIGGTPPGTQAPVRAVSGMWLVPWTVFIQGVHGGAGGYSFLCLEGYSEPDFTAAVLDSTELVIPKLTLEAQVRAAVGAEIGAWYSVSDRDAGRNPFRDGFAISVPTLGDPIPADVELWLQEIRWDLDGDGTWDITDTCAPDDAAEAPTVFDCGGTEEDPIGEFIYEYRGIYSPTVELQWDGYYIAHFSGFDVRGDFDTTDIVTADTLAGYPVIEIRSSLDN